MRQPKPPKLQKPRRPTKTPPETLLAQRVIKWLGKLTVSEGPRAGERLKRFPFQRRFIYSLMHNSEAALTIARGHGKTTLAAGRCPSA